MSEFYIGQVMMTGFNFAPRYFARCEGQLLPVIQNQALFSLLGNRYGGDGRNTFALPDLRGRTPLGAGPSADPTWAPPIAPLASSGGAENISLTTAQMPAHIHQMQASTSPADNRNPLGRVFADSGNTVLYAAGGEAVPQALGTLGMEGGDQAHPNMQPYTAINFCIALSGIFPSRQ